MNLNPKRVLNFLFIWTISDICNSGFRHDGKCSCEEDEAEPKLVAADDYKEYLCWYVEEGSYHEFWLFLRIFLNN